MLEIIIGRSANGEGETTYSWSIWNGDQQIEVNRAVHFSAAACEAVATEYCRQVLGFRPDKVSWH